MHSNVSDTHCAHVDRMNQFRDLISVHIKSEGAATQRSRLRPQLLPVLKVARKVVILTAKAEADQVSVAKTR